MAAAAAAVGAVPPAIPPAIIAPGPLIPVRLILGVCGLAPNIDRFILCHGITNMDDFEFMEPDETESIVKMHNERYRTAAQKIGFPVQKKIKGFLYWYHDRIRRQETINPADFTVARMKTAIKECAVGAARKTAERTEITVGKIETDMLWWDWKDRFKCRLDNIDGALDAPISHVIRPTMPPGWTIAQAKNDTERLIHSVSHTGPEFVIDNTTVWSELQNCTIDHPIYAWLRSFDDTKDGEGGWKALIDICEGTSATNKRLLLAARVISMDQSGGGVFYQDEYVYKFEKYTTQLHQAYVIIEKYRNKTAPETMVQRMLDGIKLQVTSILIPLAVDYVQNNLMGDWLGAVQHMSIKIAQQFPPRSGKRKQRGDPRKISEAGRGRGRGRGGRGGRGRDSRGRGGGRGRGRGGQKTHYNGVDVTDHTYKFSDTEFTAMGRDGRDQVYEMRRRDKQNRFGGRGGGGRGDHRYHQQPYDNSGQDQRQVNQASTVSDRSVLTGDTKGTENGRQLVPFHAPEQGSSEEHRARQGRGGTAGRGFGRGMYYEGRGQGGRW